MQQAAPAAGPRSCLSCPTQAGTRSHDAQQGPDLQQEQQQRQAHEQGQQQHLQLQQAHEQQQQHTLLLQLQAAQHASQQQQHQAAQLQALQAKLAADGQGAALGMGGSPPQPSEQQHLAAAALLGRLSGSLAGTTDGTGTGLSLGGSGVGNFARQRHASIPLVVAPGASSRC